MILMISTELSKQHKRKGKEKEGRKGRKKENGNENHTDKDHWRLTN